MEWSDLWAAFALYLVLEGLLPFANPGGTKRTMLKLSDSTSACCDASVSPA
jgi:uncharacterized protein YjeT (DUF2065 family)